MVVSPNAAQNCGIQLNMDGIKRSALQLLSQPDIDRKKLELLWPEIKNLPTEIENCLKIESLYKSYLVRQNSEISNYKNELGLRIPEALDYKSMSSISSELKIKLAELKPMTIGEASKIQGMTPAALIILANFIKRNNKQAA